MRLSAVLALAVAGAVMSSAATEARPLVRHEGYHAGVRGPGYARRGPVGVGLAAGVAGFAAGTALGVASGVTAPIVGRAGGTYGYAPASPLASVAYGGHTWNGLRSGLEFPIYNGFGGYYGSPDAFGDAYAF
jgi:hypothetical protein